MNASNAPSGHLPPDTPLDPVAGQATEPSTSIDVTGDEGGPLETVTTTKRGAVLATARDRWIGVSWIRPSTLVDAVVDEPPNISAADVRSSAVWHADVLRAVDGEDAVRILDIVENRISGGQIG